MGHDEVEIETVVENYKLNFKVFPRDFPFQIIQVKGDFKYWQPVQFLKYDGVGGFIEISTKNLLKQFIYVNA